MSAGAGGTFAEASATQSSIPAPKGLFFLVQSKPGFSLHSKSQRSGILDCFRTGQQQGASQSSRTSQRQQASQSQGSASTLQARDHCRVGFKGE